MLINKDVRFAAMAMREGIPCNINSQLSSMSKNVSEMIKHAIYYGYLRELNKNLDNKLSLYKGDPSEILESLSSRFNIKGIFWNRGA